MESDDFEVKKKAKFRAERVEKIYGNVVEE